MKAITAQKLQELFEFNMEVPFSSHLNRLESTKSGDRLWGGGRQRMMMSLIYAISFLCFLRMDEVLRIELRHFRFNGLQHGQTELTLDFRKTNQGGGRFSEVPRNRSSGNGIKEIKPFFLYFNREEPWLCVPSLLLEWLHISQIKSGPLFRPFRANDLPNLTKNVALVCCSLRKEVCIILIILLSPSVFRTNFRLNLQDIQENPWLYGGHSFRRGGVQYFCSEKRWNIRKLCSWGGWSLEFESLTIMRYLLGNNDDPVHICEDYMNPERQGGVLCGYCGRSCSCA